MKKIGEATGYHEIEFTIVNVKLEPYALHLFPGVTIIRYPVPVSIIQRGIDSYDLLQGLGLHDEVSSINRLDMDPNRPNQPDRMESTFYLFGRPADTRFPIAEAGIYMIHMKREKVIYHSHLPQ